MAQAFLRLHWLVVGEVGCSLILVAMLEVRVVRASVEVLGDAIEYLVARLLGSRQSVFE